MLKFVLMILFSIGLAHGDVLSGWADSNPDNTRAVDHSEWQGFLDSFLKKDKADQTYFAYHSVRENDQARLASYIASLEQINPLTLNPNEELAYWMNLYNALTVRVILEHYPVDSIRDIGGAFGGLIPTGPWDIEVTTINQQKLTLNNIEHDIVRPKFNDFRIHFGFNCAALGCPNLSEQAFTGANVDTVLDQASITFVNHPRGVRFDRNRLIVSNIFDWYLKDFVENESALPKFLAQFARTELRTRLLGYDGRIRYEYDWSLNEEPVLK